MFRLSGEIKESSASIRKDNPYRKNSSASSSSKDPSKIAYKRIFSDTSASESDELLAPNLTARKSKDKSTFMTTAEAAAKNAAAIRKKPEKGGRGRGSGKKQTQPKKTVVTRSSSSESMASESANDEKPKKMTTSEAKKAAQKSIFSDSDSESSKRPRSPMFRTKAAMKEFSVDALPSKSSKQPQKTQKQPQKPTTVLSASSSSSNSSDSESDSEPAVKTNKKSSPVKNNKNESKSKAKAKSTSKSVDSDFYPLIVPERAAARKATAKMSKDGDNLKKPVTTPAAAAAAKEASKESKKKKEVEEEEEDEEEEEEIKEEKEVVKENTKDTSKKESKEKKSSKKHHKRPPKSRSRSSTPDLEEKNIFADVIPDMSGYVPPRKAALKASVQIKDADRHVSAKEEDLLLFGPKEKKDKKAEEKKEKLKGKCFRDYFSKKNLITKFQKKKILISLYF